MPIRTFLAVSASSEMRRAALHLIENLRRNENTGDVKWVAAENLHWTLQFLGNIDEREIPIVCDALAAAATEIGSFELEARGAGAFPSADRPRTLWIGAGRGARELTVLHATIERRLRKRGYRGEDRRYVPHITFGRAGRKGRPQSLAEDLAKHADYDCGTMLVDEVTVYSSELGPGGSTYEALARVPLAE
jgi:2'-5' RNA ligase